jgi:hypothetical protein
MFVKAGVFVTNNIKDTSLLQKLPICHNYKSVMFYIISLRAQCYKSFQFRNACDKLECLSIGSLTYCLQVGCLSLTTFLIASLLIFIGEARDKLLCFVNIRTSRIILFRDKQTLYLIFAKHL